MSSRLVRALVTAAGALLLALLLNLALARPAAMQPQPAANPQLTPTAVPTAAPTDWFSATASLTVSAANAVVGNLVTVTAQLVTTGTCDFTPYDVTLNQDPPLFTYVDPQGNVIGPPGENPAVWRLAAAQSGVTTLTVSFFGETLCNGAWQWATVRSEPLTMTVTGFRVNFPWVSRNIPPLPSLPVTDLGTLGGWESDAAAINNRGEVIGSSRIATGQDHAFLWRSGVITDLGTLGDGSAYAIAINDHGQVAGASMLGPAAPYHAFFWVDGVMTDIGTLSGTGSFAVDINLGGQVLGGSSVISSGLLHSFIWASGVMTDLGTLGGDSAYPVDLNDRGQVVGYSATVSGHEHAFLWQNGVMTDLNPPGASSSWAKLINERGQVVGTYQIGSQIGNERHTFLWEGGAFTDMSQQTGITVYEIDDLNDEGQMVGFGVLASNPTRPFDFLWSDGNTLELGEIGYGLHCPTLLNNNGLIVVDSPTGPVLWRNGSIAPLELLSSFNEYDYNCPRDINDHGQIVGSSTDADGERHAVLWDVSSGE